MSKKDFTLQDAGPAYDTSKRRGARTIYVDGPNGKGDNGSHIEVFGPDRDAIASLLLGMFGAEEVKPETDAARLERFKRDILGAHGITGGDDATQAAPPMAGGCGHSACSQNYIDTGDTACIKGADNG